MHIRFEEISSVNFARSGGSTRSFDFEVETKNGVVHNFSSIEKEEYGRLYDFISNKKLRVKNSGRSVRCCGEQVEFVKSHAVNDFNLMSRTNRRILMTLMVPMKRPRRMPTWLVLKPKGKSAMLAVVFLLL